MSNRKIVLVFSGGQDSTTTLYWLLDQGYDVHAITFNYGQRHRSEILAARRIAAWADVPHEILPLGKDILKGTSPLVSDNELEQYEHYDVLPGGLEKTFVPMRNMLFFTIAANRAYVLGAHKIATGVSQEDYGGYPDCRFMFLVKFENAAIEGAFTGEDGAPDTFIIEAPLLKINKAQTVQVAMMIDGCYEALALSHTAYDGKYPPTGQDHASLLRAKGFEEALVPDPLVVRAHMEGLMDLPDHPMYHGLAMEKAKQRVSDVIDWLEREEDGGL